MSSSRIAARFVGDAAGTRLERLHEAGSLRLRLPRVGSCEAVLVNTGGGIVGGDRLDIELALSGPGALATATTVAAEKVYRSAGGDADVSTRLRVAGGAELHWLPQETILFDGARVRRRFDLSLDAGCRLIAAETVVFGRLAKAETAIGGLFRDSWRIRCDGTLVFADDTLLDGDIAGLLDRPCLAAGARAAALLLVVQDGAEHLLDPLRAAAAPFAAGDGADAVSFGASSRNGMVVARGLAHSPERLRASMMSLLGVLRALPLPRSW